VLDRIEARVLRRLPITTSLVEAHLYVFDGERWRVRARLPFSDTCPEPAASSREFASEFEG
jgi:hypothetical protein